MASIIPTRMYNISEGNIGLIEVMGLAILPPRLKEEVEQVASYLVGRMLLQFPIIIRNGQTNLEPNIQP